jgi:hypothetical protein
VPDAAVTATDLPLRGPQSVTRHLGRHPVNGREWDLLEMEGIQVSSAYWDGSMPGLVDRGLWSFLWRASFGFPLGRKVADDPSFFAVPMKARLYMAWREASADNDLGVPAYQTFLFGGTINQRHSARSHAHREENEAFLAAQLEAVERVMRRDYPALGF